MHYYHAATGNFPTVTRVLLAKIPQHDGRMTYRYDERNTFHYVVESGVCYLCMSDEPNRHRIPSAFLNDVRDAFVAEFGVDEPATAIAFSYNERFAPKIKELMEHYNSGSPDVEAGIDSIGNVKNQIEEVKENMVQNISSLLERGERLELLVEKTDNLNQQAFRFESSGRNLRRAMYWRQVRCRIGVGLAALFLIFVASASMCGGLDFRHCRK